ncbi:conserved protein, unknown function [Hepatocystis sp. ex Piliocolobus tephrosceles]|nr:conserved protein, unknown function [Hepatocystis sp. ex Piliocolobus tephrosceles]
MTDANINQDKNYLSENSDNYLSFTTFMSVHPPNDEYFETIEDKEVVTSNFLNSNESKDIQENKKNLEKSFNCSLNGSEKKTENQKSHSTNELDKNIQKEVTITESNNQVIYQTKNDVTKNDVTKNDVTKNDVTKNDVTKNDVTGYESGESDENCENGIIGFNGFSGLNELNGLDGLSNKCEYNKKKDKKISEDIVKDDIGNIFNVIYTGINKIESIKALCITYKNNLNESFRKKINQLNTMIYFYNNNNNNNKFGNDMNQNYINMNERIAATKMERLSRLFLYIEDMNKLKQSLKAQQNMDNKSVEDDGSKECFYDANEHIDHFYVYDNTFSCPLIDVDSVFTESGNSSFNRDDSFIDSIIEDSQNNSNQDLFNISNLFTKLSLKNNYMFDINKNLCAIYDSTPMIFKNLAKKINSYNLTKSYYNKDITNIKEDDDINFKLNHKNIENFNNTPSYLAIGNHNLDTYIQLHCERWQENLYDMVEVNSLEFSFQRMNCSIM